MPAGSMTPRPQGSTDRQSTQAPLTSPRSKRRYPLDRRRASTPIPGYCEPSNRHLAATATLRCRETALRADTSQPLAYDVDPDSLSAAELELLDKLEREFADRATGEQNSVSPRAPRQPRSDAGGASRRRRKPPRPRKSRERDRRDHLAMNGLDPRDRTKPISPLVRVPRTRGDDPSTRPRLRPQPRRPPHTRG